MSTYIHPSAIIESGAKLDDFVTVGPFAYVGSEVRLGAGTVIHHHATVDRNTIIGCDCEVFPYAYIGGMTQDLKYKGGSPGVKVGDRCVFREYSSVHIATHEGEATTLGDDNLLLAYAHVAHDCKVGNHLVMSSHSALGGHAIVGDHVNIGWDAGVHQYCRVGDFAMVGACSKVVQDIPPYMIGDGNPAEVRTVNKIGMQRAGFTDDEITIARFVYRCLYRDGLNRTQALTKMRDHNYSTSPVVETVINFIEHSERGLA